MINEDRKKLYDALSSEYDLGTYEEFERNIGDSVKRKKLYDAASADYDLGDFENYSQRIGPTHKESLDAFTAEHGSWLNDFEARDSAETNMSKAGMSSGIYVPAEGAITGEERKRYMELHKQEEALKKAWFTSDEYLAQKDADALFLSDARKGLSKQMMEYAQANPVLRQEGPFQINPYATRGAEADTELEKYRTASRILDDAIKMHNAPSKYDDKNVFLKFRKGAGDVLSDADFWTAGLTEIADNLGVRDVLSSVQEKLGNLNDLSEEAIENILSPAEKAVLQAWALDTQEQLKRKDDLSRAYQAGQGATESLGFMAEFALTGGIGKAATEGVEQMAKWLGKKALTKVGGMTDDVAAKVLKETGEKIAQSTIGKYGVGLAESLAEAAGRTGVMPSTFRNISEKATEIETDENGNNYLVKMNDAFAKGYVDSFIENLSEGGRVNALGTLFGDVAGKIPAYKKMVDKFSHTKASELWEAFNSSGVMNTLRAGGWHGLGEEYLEEWYGNALRTLTGVDKEALKDFATVDNQIVTLTSFLPMTIFGGTVSTAQVLSANKDLEKKAAALKSALMERGYDEAQANNMIDMMRGAAPAEVSETLTPIVNSVANRNTNEAAALMKPVGEFAAAVQRWQSFNTKYNYQEQEQRDGLRAQMEENLGQFWQQDENGRQTVQRGVNKKGEVVYMLGKPSVEDVEAGVTSEVAAVTSDGRKVFVNPSEYQLEDELEMNTFLGNEIMAEKGNQEQARMIEEKEAKIAAIRETAVPGTAVNIGTAEVPMQAIVLQRNPDGVIVNTPDGQTRQMTYEELGNYVGINAAPMTDAQIDEHEANVLTADRSQREAALDQEYNNEDAALEELSEAEDEIEQAVDANTPLPLKADGSVDQTALWNKDPEGWAQWNDEKRQDGGADSLAYVTNAIAVEQAKMAELQTARSQETDFDRRDALDAEIATAQERINRLVAIQQGYLAQPAVADAVQNVQPEPQTEEEKAKAEDKRREPLRKRAKEFGEKLGVKVNIAESLADVKEEQAREEILGAEVSGSGARFPGWYDRETGEVTIYLPHVKGVADIDRTIVHEVVAHKGLRGLLGKEGYNVLCDAVWDMMTEAERAKYMAYPGVDGDKRLAADEYIARFAEGLDLEQSRPIWNKIAEAVQKILNSMGIRLEVTKEDLADLIAASYMRLQEQARAAQTENAPVVEEATEEATEEAVPEVVVEEQIPESIEKPADPNGVSQEQLEEINKATGGEIETGKGKGSSLSFSVVALGEGAGIEILKDDGQGNVAFVHPDGRIFNANNPIKPEDLKTLPNTVLGYMMKDAKSLGVVDPAKERMLWNKYTLMLNAILSKGSAENGGYEYLSSQWQWIGDTIYKTVAINSDSQYSFSLDITRVCKKNEAVINAIAEMQARLGYGITPGQIMDIYLTTSEEGYQVPCPVCYVFSRYIRNGKYATIMINGQRKYGSKLVDPKTLTPAQKKRRIEYWLNELDKIKAENKANSKEIAKANSDITTLLDEIDKLSKQLTDPSLNLTEEQKSEMIAKIYELDARYKAALNVVSQASLDSWITQFAIHKAKVDGKEQWVLFEDSYMGFPEEMALDLRQTATVMRKYPAIQRFRNSRGAAAGKEITFVANNDLGDAPLALGSAGSTKDLAKPREMSEEEWKTIKDQEFAELKLGVKNLYQQAVQEKDPAKKKKILEAAKRRFTAASVYAKQQSLRGGQRMWSWSDNIERLAPDVFVNLLQLEMLGGALQSYSKQLEGIKLVASMNGYVNGSLMGKGNGYREVSREETEEIDGQLFLKDGDFIVAEPGKKPFVLKTPVYQHTDGKLYVLEFDDVVGIDPFGKEVDGKHMKGLFELNAEYDRAGNIIVGMNDLHIRMCMADDRIFFIIPWHSSGANTHILAQMYEYLGVEYDAALSQDYTNVQSEKRYKAPTETEEETDETDIEETTEEEEGKKPESNKISQFLVDFWDDHYENAREFPGYGKVAGKDFACGIEGGVEPSDGNGNLSASQMHYRELRDAIFVGVKVPNGVDKNGKAKTKNIPVEEYSEEWLNEIMNDEFLSQVYSKVRAMMGNKGMTNADTKAIYPYEYWDENSTYDTADINGARYLEYCRRLGYKPKFCGKLDGKPETDFGNFTDDKGYWKVLIDRRMYGLSGRFQDLTPVTAENFTPDLVDPEVTKEEFVVTRVADEAGTQTIVDKAIAREESRPGGIARVDYDMTLSDALDVYAGRKPAPKKSGVIDLVEEAKKAVEKEEAKKPNKGSLSFRMTTEMKEIKEKAQADGTFMKAPNGQPTNLTEEQWLMVRTQNFKNWFGDWINDPENASKVVDENGEPKVVYHQTNQKIYVNRETGENWDELGWKEKMEWDNRDDWEDYWEERDFNTFSRVNARTTNEFDGFFFAPEYDEYHEYGDRTIAAFVNIKNPASREDYNIDSRYNDAGRTERIRLQEAGFDGVIRMDGDNVDEYIAFEPNQIKSATDNNGDFNPKNNDISFRAVNDNQAIFVSNAAKAVEGIKQEKATPEQWMKMIEKNGGLKAGEDKWMGLSDWLKASDKKTLTKQEVLDFVNKNMIIIEEQHYDINAEDDAERAHSEITEKLQDRFDHYEDEYYQEKDWDGETEDARAYAIEKLREDMGDTFPYTIELEYGNVYLTFPYEEEDDLVKWAEKTGVEYTPGVAPINDTRLGYTTDGLENKHEIALTVPTIERWGDHDEIHFGDAGDGRAIAWIRFGETEVPTAEYKALLDEHDRLKDVAKETYDEFGGHSEEFHEAERRRYKIVEELRSHNNPGHKVLVIDEIQSKRHQEGREKGYKSKDYWPLRTSYLENKTVYESLFDEMAAKYGEEFTDAPNEEFAKRVLDAEDYERIMKAKTDFDAAADAYIPMRNAIPDAPFDKNWHELAMKRMLRYAAENGYDAIAWTKGEQQADRYNLGKIYNEIEREDNPNIEGRTFSFSGGNYDKVTVNEDGVVVDSTIEEAKGKSLSDLVGKDLAVKMMSLENYDTIDGEDLRIGGEGMKGFYDKMLPAFMNKYGKKWGVKVEDINLPNLENGLTMHSVPVTEEMKVSVMGGQVMFRMRTEEEDAMEFTQQAINDCTSRYNEVAEVKVFPANEETAERFGYTMEEMQETGGTYLKDEDIIAIFALQDIKDSRIFENIFFHESIHKLAEFYPEFKKIGEWMWNNADVVGLQKIKDNVKKAYEQEWHHEEMLAYGIANAMSLGRVEQIESGIPEEYKSGFRQILNEIGYEPEKESRRDESRVSESIRRGAAAMERKTDESGRSKKEEARTGELTAEERRIIGEYFPEFNKSEDVRMKVNSQGKDLTEGQKEFFANSKAVDKDGNLLVLYHGTPRAGFTEFKSGWFTTSKEDAISYSGDRKGRLFDPNEKYEPETLTAGDFPLGYMTFDSEEDRAAFLAEYPGAENAIPEAEFDSMTLQADEEYDDLIARKPELQQIWKAYREYERERLVDSTIGDLLSNPQAYTEEDFMRAMLAYDSNANFDSLDDISAEERKDALVSALQTANEETEGGILDMAVPTRVPRNGEGIKHNDLGNRTYEVYANVENPYEIDANGRGSEFESGDIYKAVEKALADEQYDGVIIRNWRVGRTQQLGDVVVPKNGSQIKLTSNENPTKSHNVSFRTSLELDEEFGDAWRNQQNEDGRHSTQVANTKSTYEKIGRYLEDAGMKGASILDASSGLGLGTQALREMGFQVDDVEPFPSENREAPTFSSYADIDGKYDVVISNAVLNVIPDDWRADVLHQMADAVKEGGKMIINTRPASNIAQQGVEGKTRITLDSPSEILVKRGDRIAAYQKGFTSEELAEWIKSELGEGWRVEKATKKNSGISGEGTAVVIKEGDNVSFRVTGTPADEVVANGLTLTPAQTAEVAANIFAALPEESRKKITDGLNGNILGLKDAILQIPASLATKENWNEEDGAMADVVAEEMTKMAGEMTRPFSAPEALWLLYNNLNKGNDLISQASRALVQRNLGFDEETLERQEEAKQGVSFRMVGDATANAKASMYNRGAVNVWTRLKESFVDMQASVEELVSAIEKATGKVAKGFENILLALNQQPSKGLAAMESYEQRFLMPMFDEIRKIMDDTKMKYEDVVRYVILKHGLERNKKLAQRDAKAHYQEIYDKILGLIRSMSDSQRAEYYGRAQKRMADAKTNRDRLRAIDTTAFTDEQKADYKKEFAKAMKEVEEAAQHLFGAEKVANMSEKEVERELQDVFDSIEKGTNSKYQELRKNDYSGISSMFYDQLGVNRKDYSTEEEYQAALMLAKNDRFSSLEEVEAQAEGEVSSFEGRVDTKELWKRINAATKETLRQQYEANMISKDQYESLRDMFEYYVPLRGFKDNTAEDMYTYYRKPNSTGYTKPILGAEGRKTEAESPFGWIAAMAGSAIASNVKNEAKLALYYFVSNRPNNGIATLSRTWFVHTPGDMDANGKKIFKPAYPPFSEDLSSDAAKQAYEDWQEQMRDLQKQGLAYEAGQRLNLGNAVVNISDANKPEHVVTVKVAGKDYTIVINGNPRAAQAINGELNIESTADDYSAIFGPVLRWMSSVNTSYNPEFWITNLMRDMAFTWMAVNTKEDPAYRKKFSKNYWKCFRVIGLVAKNERGTIGNSYMEDMYKDFVKYGGVTGYTQIKDSETWEKEIDNYLSSTDPESLKNGKMMRGMKTFFHAAHRFGESLEQVSRFAAFLTSREMGKTINEAIADAKEITVNFNRKGSGKMITLEESKYLTDKNGQPLSLPARWAAVGLSSIAPLGRRTIMFFNAAVQGLNSVYRLWKKNPKRLAGWTAAYFAIGVMNAALHAMLDDDDDYLDIPQYERRNSLMLGGNGAYLKWALPQEARVFYALGDIAVESVMGRNPHQNVVGEAFKVVTEILPVNPTEGWKAFVPSVAIPAVELMLNEDYKGAPIYNEQKWLSKEERERTAKWSSAYQGTGTMYKGIAQGLNYITGGDKHDAGMINLQPEKMEHLVQSAFGGTIRTADKFINTIWAMFDPEEDVTVRQTPFLNRILTLNDERFKNVHVNEVFDYYKADADHALTLEKKYRKDRDQESLNELRRSDEYQWAKVYRKYKKALDNLKEKLKVAEGTAERKELMRQQDELKRRVIKEISEL